MKNLALQVRNFLVSEDGPTAVEYAVMLALIIVVCLTAIQAIGTRSEATFNSVAQALPGLAAVRADSRPWWSRSIPAVRIRPMPPAPSQPQHSSDNLRLANVLDRLAGALEQQARMLLELKDQVGSVAGGLQQVERRLAAIEDKAPAEESNSSAEEAKPKPAPKKRAK